MKNGWKGATLGEAFITQTGNTPPKGNAELYGDFMPLVKPPELCDSQLDSAEDGLSEAGAAVARILPPQSILVSCIGNLGKIGLNIISVAFNQQINAILPDKSQAIPKFIFFQALSTDFKEQLEALASGTTVPIVNKSKFNSIKIVLPPLPEQRRIIGILDEAFEGIATAKANTQQNLTNSFELRARILNAVLSERQGNGRHITFGDVVAKSRGGCNIRSTDYRETGIPVLTKGDVKQFGRVEPGGKYINSNAKGPAFPLTSSGDLMVTTRDLKPSAPFLGMVAQIPVDRRYVVSQGATVFSLNETLVLPEFFVYSCCSSRYRDHIRSKKVGSTQVHIRQEDLFAAPVWVPSITRQKQIVSLLDQATAETTRVARLYEHKLDALEALKKSLLHQAFAGEL